MSIEYQHFYWTKKKKKRKSTQLFRFLSHQTERTAIQRSLYSLLPEIFYFEFICYHAKRYELKLKREKHNGTKWMAIDKMDIKKKLHRKRAIDKKETDFLFLLCTN